MTWHAQGLPRAAVTYDAEYGHVAWLTILSPSCSALVYSLSALISCSSDASRVAASCELPYEEGERVGCHVRKVLE